MPKNNKVEMAIKEMEGMRNYYLRLADKCYRDLDSDGLNDYEQGNAYISLAEVIAKCIVITRRAL